MTETAEAYASRLGAYTEGKDPITMHGSTAYTRAVDRRRGRKSATAQPAAGKWSVTEILAHLAEDELTSTWRYRQMFEYDSPVLAASIRTCGHVSVTTARGRARRPSRCFACCGKRIAEVRAAHSCTMAARRRARRTGKDDRARTLPPLAAHDMNHIDQVKRILGR
jgi:hypothetical protein